MSAHHATPRGPGDERVAVEGRNCWRRLPADRVAFLIDGQAYYHAFKSAVLSARDSVLIIGWDIDSRTKLDREPGASEPNSLGELLSQAARAQPGLRVNVLIWDTALIYRWNREFWTDFKFRWFTPRRVRFRLDDSHPLGASHHQKVVVIDDAVAFIGGLDFTSGRWDTPAHAGHEPRRFDTVTGAYPPFHDVMMMLSGPVAGALGDLARNRWRCATGQRLPPPPPGNDPWPHDVTPVMRDVMAAIARTLPAWEGEPTVREVERLYLDMVVAARRFIFFENQFFASRGVGRALLGRLIEDAPPEVLAISCQEPLAFLERTTMGAGRARLYARLRAADRNDRLRVFYPMVDGIDVKVHSKLAIIDDRMVRIGSANLNNRSMGLDTECDVLIEACGDPQVEAAIRHLRHQLLGEHLGIAPDQYEIEERTLGMLTAIDTLRGGGGARTLTPIVAPLPAGAEALISADIVDPDQPLEALLLPDEIAPGRGNRAVGQRLGTFMAALIMFAAAAAIARLVRPLEASQLAQAIAMLQASAWTVPAMMAIFLVGGLTVVPVTLLLIACGVIFGLWGGFLWGLVGALASALLAFSVGRIAGRDRLRRLIGRRMTRVIRALPRRGVLMITVVRLVPVASYTVANLVAGAARTRLSDYLVGTILGMTPVTAALVLFGDRLAAVLRDPDIFHMAVLLALTAALVVIEHSLTRRLARGIAPGPDEEGKV